MVRRRKKADALPSAPGWYPDPFSATGTGERYFDGKKWTSNADRAERVVSELPGRHRRRLRKLRKARPLPSGNRRRLLAPAIFIVVVLITWWFQYR